MYDDDDDYEDEHDSMAIDGFIVFLWAAALITLALALWY
jgi:hypothetical protein